MTTLQEIRTQKTNFLGYALVAAAGVGMLFIGLPPLFGSGGNNPAIASVDGVDIRLDQYNQAYHELQNNNPDLPAVQLKELAMRQSIERTLLEQQALNNHYTLSNKALYRIIKEQFGDDKTYQGWLSNRRLNAETYQNSVRREETVRRYYQMLQPPVSEQSPLFQDYLRALVQKRSYTLYVLPVAPVAAKLEPTEADIQNYYDAHQNNYLTPEAVDINYTIFRAADVGDPSTITDDALAKAKAETEQRAGNYLIFDDPKIAAEAAGAIESGAKTFADYQKAIENNSIAGEAGALDLAANGKGVLPEIDKALFALPKIGAVSPVIKSDSGNILIELTAIKATDKSDDEWRQTLANKASEGRYTELANQAYDAAQSGKPLSAIVGITGGKVETLEGVIASNDSKNWLQNPDVQKQLFGEKGLAVGKTALPVEISPDQSLFFTVTKREPAAPRPLADIRGAVEQDYRTSVAAETLQKEGETLLTALEKGDDVKTLLSQYDAKTEALTDVNRLASARPELLDPLFATAERFSVHHLPSGEIVVAQLDGVKAGELSDLPEPIRNNLFAVWQAQMAGAFGQDLSQWLYNRASIKIDQNIFQKL